jgi:hypothetical protein
MTTINLEQNKVLIKAAKYLTLTKKLERLKFEKQIILLYNQIQKIEDKLDEKAAINYLKGYLEDHGIPMEDFIKAIKNI